MNNIVQDNEDLRNNPEIVAAPWSDEVVKALELFQSAKGIVHPYTYDLNGQNVNLIPTTKGWIAEPGGQVVQDWCGALSVSEEIQEMIRNMKGLKEGTIKPSDLE